jgi:hypothetical protein
MGIFVTSLFARDADLSCVRRCKSEPLRAQGEGQGCPASIRDNFCVQSTQSNIEGWAKNAAPPFKLEAHRNRPNTYLKKLRQSDAKHTPSPLQRQTD